MLRGCLMFIWSRPSRNTGRRWFSVEQERSQSSKSLSDYYVALQAWKANALADLESELADLMVAHRTLH